jgi:hypothetical protein
MNKLSKVFSFLFIVGIIGVVVYFALLKKGQNTTTSPSSGTTGPTTTTSGTTTTASGTTTPASSTPAQDKPTTDAIIKGLGGGAIFGISLVPIMLIALGIYIYRHPGANKKNKKKKSYLQPIKNRITELKKVMESKELSNEAREEKMLSMIDNLLNDYDIFKQKTMNRKKLSYEEKLKKIENAYNMIVSEIDMIIKDKDKYSLETNTKLKDYSNAHEMHRYTGTIFYETTIV